MFVRVQLEIRFHLLVKEEQNSHALIIATDKNVCHSAPIANLSLSFLQLDSKLKKNTEKVRTLQFSHRPIVHCHGVVGFSDEFTNSLAVFSQKATPCTCGNLYSHCLVPQLHTLFPVFIYRGTCRGRAEWEMQKLITWSRGVQRVTKQ